MFQQEIVFEQTSHETKHLNMQNENTSKAAFSASFLQNPAAHNINIILLNTPLPQEGTNTCVDNILQHAKKLVCADGGANRLFTYSKTVTPTYICGDFDSVKPEVLEFYKSKGVTAVCISDQNSNDLQKCLQVLVDTGNETENSKLLPSESGSTITVVYGGGGRLDQEMCNLHALLQYQDKLPNLMLYSQFNLCYFLMPDHQHRILFNKEIERKTCGLIPLGKKCDKVETTGLRWNLNGDAMEFGGLISTSNEIVGDSVTVKTSDPLLWISTMKM